MCSGAEDEKQSCSNASQFPDNNITVSCELCNARALLYCPADDAFLCQECDKWVHGANFLSQRHVRCLLCNSCHKPTRQYLVGASALVMLPEAEAEAVAVSSEGRNQFDSTDDGKWCSRTLGTPFLFL